MRYYKTISGSYISAIGTGAGGGEEITESEYNTIMSLIHDKPTPLEGYDYRLRADLIWQLGPVTALENTDPELTAEEALGIILGGNTE